MATIHFLNVNEGDCSIIEHNSGRKTVIDVCNAKARTLLVEATDKVHKMAAAAEKGVNGNFNQKAHPVNPILYMQDRGINSVFRFILTHPDMDHMGGIKAFFEALSPSNFWDTDNEEEKEFGDGANGGFNEDDWKFYKALRNSESDPKRLALYSGEIGQYWNKGADQNSNGDGLHILAPAKTLVATANECSDYNDCSFVIQYKTGNHNIVFAGDSHDETWEHILENHKDVKNVDLLIAPHHGRHSDRDWEFLDVINPALTLFGNAGSEHLAYSAWGSRGLPIITNNQAGNIIIDASADPMDVYVTCEAFAKASNPYSFYSQTFGAHYWGEIKRSKSAVA
jgi:competence protein ComEC